MALKGGPYSVSSYQLGQRSSVLAPTSCKLTKQVLVLQHMNSHVKGIRTAKSAIDSSCPKTWLTNTKIRDQARRERMKKGFSNVPSRPTSQPSSRPTSASGDRFSSTKAYYEDSLTDYRKHPSEENYYERDFSLKLSSGTPQRRSRPNSASSAQRRSSYNLNSARSYNSQNPRQNILDSESGDLLVSRSYRFTEAKPFTPRILHRKAPSRLRANPKIYNPKPSKPHANVATGKSLEEQEEHGPVVAMETNEEAETLALDDSLDPDKVKWLEEQSRDGEIRTKTNPRSNLVEINRGHRDLTEFSDSVSKVCLSQTMRKVRDEDEELKYLNFISDVTTDILNRNIFTNKVFRQVLEYHIDKNKDTLKYEKMRSMTEKIRLELGIPERDDQLEGTFGYGSTRQFDYDTVDSPYGPEEEKITESKPPISPRRPFRHSPSQSTSKTESPQHRESPFRPVHTPQDEITGVSGGPGSYRGSPAILAAVGNYESSSQRGSPSSSAAALAQYQTVESASYRGSPLKETTSEIQLFQGSQLNETTHFLDADIAPDSRYVERNSQLSGSSHFVDVNIASESDFMQTKAVEPSALSTTTRFVDVDKTSYLDMSQTKPLNETTRFVPVSESELQVTQTVDVQSAPPVAKPRRGSQQDELIRQTSVAESESSVLLSTADQDDMAAYRAQLASTYDGRDMHSPPPDSLAVKGVMGNMTLKPGGFEKMQRLVHFSDPELTEVTEEDEEQENDKLGNTMDMSTLQQSLAEESAARSQNSTALYSKEGGDEDF